MRPIVVIRDTLPFKAGGMTTFPVIWVLRGLEGDACLMAHEEVHWMHQRRWARTVIGWPLWFACYGVMELVRRARGLPAEMHPWEREAYRVQRECIGG